MKYRLLERGVALTEVGLGAAQFGNLNRKTTQQASTEAVAAAWDVGIRYFDTAPHYGVGLSERRLGTALAGYPRDEFVLSTKVGRLLVPSPETQGMQDPEGFKVPANPRREWDFSRDGILRSIEASLARLGMDRIDIAYLHDPDDHWAAASTTGIQTLIELRDQGVVRAIGAGMNQSAMPTAFVRECDVDVMMIAGRFTLLEQPALVDLMPAALDRGVGIVAAGVYNSGLLSNPTVRADSTFNYAPAPPDLVARARAIAEICNDHGVTLPEVAVQWPLRHPAVVSVVLGTSSAEHAVSAAERYSASIPDSLWGDLTEAGILPSETSAR